MEKVQADLDARIAGREEARRKALEKAEAEKERAVALKDSNAVQKDFPDRFPGDL